jgi:acyl-CoA synthetase (AMP-forming)/AMP-acid ligase II
MQRKVCFEITYANLIADVQTRRQVITNAKVSGLRSLLEFKLILHCRSNRHHWIKVYPKFAFIDILAKVIFLHFTAFITRFARKPRM